MTFCPAEVHPIAIPAAHAACAVVVLPLFPTLSRRGVNHRTVVKNSFARLIASP